MSACPSCSAALPQSAIFCPRCGRSIETTVAVRETPQSLLRQAASLLQQCSKRKLGVKFVGSWWGEDKSPKAKTRAVRFHVGMGILDSSKTFVILPRQGKYLFADGQWADLSLNVMHEAGIEDAKAFAENYRNLTGKTVELIKQYI